MSNSKLTYRQLPKIFLWLFLIFIGAIIIIAIIDPVDPVNEEPKRDLVLAERYIKAKEANIRIGPGVNFEIDPSSPILKNERIFVHEEIDNWLKFTVLESDTSWFGYVSKDLTTTANGIYLDRYISSVNKLQTELGFQLIESISVSDNKAKITVSNIWHTRNKQLRLQDAQGLWEIWASIRSPKDPDKARIELVDLRGNKVGGSRSLAGSLIQVND